MTDENSPRSLVTAVVTTRNSATTLERCLASVRQQTYPSVELIVVDNGSTDATKEIAMQYTDLVIDVGPERSAQRNAGVRAGRGAYVLIVDSDMILSPPVIQECVEVARGDGAAAVIIPERSVGTTFVARLKAMERDCYLGDDLIEAPRFFSRQAFERHGGYNEEITGPEDWELPARMRKHERISRISALIFHDEGSLRLRTLVGKKFYYGRGAYRYARLHPELAFRQAVPFRAAFFRRRRLLARRPVLALAMLGMKIAEAGAAAAGALAEAAADRRSWPRR